MNIVTQLLLIVLGISVLFTVIIFQVVTLARIYRCNSWWAGAAVFILAGARQIYGLVKLPSAILEAQLKGVMIQSLTWEQWFTVGWAYLIAIGFIVWLDWLRRDLAELGIGYGKRRAEELEVR